MTRDTPIPRSILILLYAVDILIYVSYLSSNIVIEFQPPPQILLHVASLARACNELRYVDYVQLAYYKKNRIVEQIQHYITIKVFIIY